ncbi:hypothetical protein ACFE04_025945 [Oxalis oulophora]
MLKYTKLHRLTKLCLCPFFFLPPQSQICKLSFFYTQTNNNNNTTNHDLNSHRGRPIASKSHDTRNSPSGGVFPGLLRRMQPPAVAAPYLAAMSLAALSPAAHRGRSVSGGAVSRCPDSSQQQHHPVSRGPGSNGCSRPPWLLNIPCDKLVGSIPRQDVNRADEITLCKGSRECSEPN